jgi:tetratricopeptide (TPR) repeat protein
MFQEAIADFTKAIELDEDVSDAYFNRGKCAYLLGDTALAFLDFQKLILLEPVRSYSFILLTAYLEKPNGSHICW